MALSISARLLMLLRDTKPTAWASSPSSPRSRTSIAPFASPTILSAASGEALRMAVRIAELTPLLVYAEPSLVPVTLRVGVSASEYTQSPSRDLEGSVVTPILPSSATKSHSVRAAPLATATLLRMSATHEYSPFAVISRSALPTRLLCQGTDSWSARALSLTLSVRPRPRRA